MRLRRAIAAAGVALLGGSLVLAGALPAAAEDPATLELSKTSSVASASPGDTFTYTIQVSCIYAGLVPASGCTNAEVVDVVPDEFEVLSVSVANYAAYTQNISGQTVTVLFTSPFQDPAGSVGMLQGSNATLSISVRVRDLPYSANGVPVTNTATFSASNPSTAPATDTAVVFPVVPLTLSTDVTKEFEPSGAVASPGEPVDMNVQATNTSADPVTQLVVLEPTDPSASTPFTQLAYTGLDVTMPPDADRVQVDAYISGGWVLGTPAATAALPAGVAPGNVLGLRFTFTSTTGMIQPDATADITVHAQQRDLGEVDEDISVPNEATSSVTRDSATASDTDDANYTIFGNSPEVSAGKTITPTYVGHGDTVNAELTATNEWESDLSQLSIVEPALTSDDPYSDGFTDAMSFAGFADTAPTWPANADAASVTYYYEDDTSETIEFVQGEPIPEPTQTGTVVRFRVDFTGEIFPDSSATVNATIGTDPDDPAPLTEITNAVTAEGTAPSGATGSDVAEDTFWAYLRIVTPFSGKRLVPGAILGSGGEWTVLQLPSGTAPLPDEIPEDDPYSSGSANQIIVQDPAATSPTDDTPQPSPFWDVFSPDRITSVQVPAGSTLTVNYWDGDSWEELAGPIAGLTTWSYDIAGNAPPSPADIGGLQFVFESDAGFPPGTSVQPNVVMNLDNPGALDYDADGIATIENCASTGATSETAVVEDAEPACDTIDVYDPDSSGNGIGDLISKNWSDVTVTARTGDLRTAHILWSTGGFSDIDSMTISDIPSPDPDAVTDSVYNAFDLYRVNPISPTLDEYIPYDSVATLQLYSDSLDQWVGTETDPCAAPGSCDGQFPGYTLSAAERADTIGVRLVFVENPNRASLTDPLAPPVGSGVARSIGNTRGIDLQFQIRDEARDGSGVVTGHRDYNDGPSLVRNDVGAVGERDGVDLDDSASSTIEILDTPLLVDFDKQWTGGPLAVPPAGTAPGDYPSGRVTLSATNATDARVDTMSITDPYPASAEPFNAFDLIDVVSVDVPAGTASWTATFVRTTGGDLVVNSLADPYDTSPLTVLGEADLINTTAVSIEFDGRINSQETGGLVFDLRLRALLRGTTTAVTAPDDFLNAAQASLDDAGRDTVTFPTAPTASDGGTMSLVDADLGIDVSKGFAATATDTPLASGFFQTEPDNDTFFMTLTAQPTGSVRVNEMTVIDVDPTFWNAYEFVGFAPFSPAQPIDQVRVDAFTGGDFVGDLGDPAVTVNGGGFLNGVAGPSPALPSSVTDPAAVQGLRIIYTRADGDQWENSEHPEQSITVEVRRRAVMLTGQPVPTDLPGNVAAPGESAAGTAENTIDGSTSSFLTDGDGDPLLTADADPVSATVEYRHSLTAVQVSKAPAGVQTPGTLIPYTLTVTNNGDTPITDPVIVDDLPTYNGQSALILSPDASEPFGYALTGAAPSGSPLPTDPDVVSVADDIANGAAPSLTFTFPSGSVLDVGQTYTITIAMLARPGVPANVNLTNTVTVSGERPFDACNGSPQDPPAEACSADTTIYLAAGGALRSGKLVRAIDDSLGVFSVLDGVTCTPFEDDFYAPPCVPITAPLGREQWRLLLLNTGTLPLSQVVLMDRLPVPGDTGVLNPVQRGSEFAVTLTNALAATDLPSGATVTVFGTTSEPCDADLRPLTQSCDPGDWVAIADLDLADVTALKYEIDFAPEAELQPGERFSIEYQTQTPAASPGGDDPIAWNTLATGGVTDDGQSTAELLPVEGNKVGVALATGEIALEKALDGDASGFAPDSFTAHLECTIEGETVYEDDVTLEPDQPVTVGELPLGAECTFTGEDDSGQTSWSSSSGTVTRAPTEVQTVTLTNVYDAADLVIGKVVATDALDENGDPPQFGPFLVAVQCTFLGDRVYADGYGALAPMWRLLEADETWLLAGLPVGSQCHVGEVTTAGASSTSITVVTVDGSVTTAGTGADVTLTANEATAVNAVAITNTYAVGSLAIEKRVVGPGASEASDVSFTFHVTCTMDTIISTRVVYDGDVEVAPPYPATLQNDTLPVGAECTVVETDDGGAGLTYLLPNPLQANSATVTIVGDEVVQVTAFNYFAPPPDPGDELSETGWDGYRLELFAFALLGFGWALVRLRRA